MTLLLALDTASAAVSVALHDADTVLARRTAEPSPRHAELLSPLIAEVLEEAGARPADLTRVAAGVGPGPFTGLRIGLVTAQMLGAVLEIPVDGVCSLDALALAVLEVAPQPGEFLVATDARRKEVYWARYRSEAGLPVRLDGPTVTRPGDLDTAGLPVFGRGTLLYPDQLHAGRPAPQAGAPALPLDPSAVQLGRLALASAPAGEAGYLLPPVPLYLRRPDAVPGAPKRVR